MLAIGNDGLGKSEWQGVFLRAGRMRAVGAFAAFGLKGLPAPRRRTDRRFRGRAAA